MGTQKSGFQLLEEYRQKKQSGPIQASGEEDNDRSSGLVLLQEYKRQRDVETLATDIDSWFQESTDINQAYNNWYKNGGVSQSDNEVGQVYNDVRFRRNSLVVQGMDIKNRLWQYEDIYGKETVETIAGQIDSMISSNTDMFEAWTSNKNNLGAYRDAKAEADKVEVEIVDPVAFYWNQRKGEELLQGVTYQEYAEQAKTASHNKWAGYDATDMDLQDALDIAERELKTAQGGEDEKAIEAAQQKVSQAKQDMFFHTRVQNALPSEEKVQAAIEKEDAAREAWESAVGVNEKEAAEKVLEAASAERIRVQHEWEDYIGGAYSTDQNMNAFIAATYGKDSNYTKENISYLSSSGLSGADQAVWLKNKGYTWDEIGQVAALMAGDAKNGDNKNALLNFYNKTNSSQVRSEVLNELFGGNFIVDTAATVISIPVQLVGSVLAAGEDTVGYVSGNGIDTENSFGNLLLDAVDITRGAVSMDVAEWAEDHGISADLAVLVYNMGVSTADSLAAFGVGAVSGMPQLGLALMGTQSMASTIRDCKERGLTDEQAYSTGLIAGLVEVITEKLPFSELEKIVKASKKGTVKEVIKALGNNLYQSLKEYGFTEGREELIAEVVNFIADQTINNGNTSVDEGQEAYLSDGITENILPMSSGEALWKAMWDVPKQMIESYVSGMFSGLIMGGGTVAISTVTHLGSNQAVGKYVQNRGLTQSALSFTMQYIESDTADYKRVQGWLETAQNGGELSNSDIGKALKLGVKAYLKNTESTLTEAIEKSGVPTRTAGDMTQKLIRGEELTSGEVGTVIYNDAVRTAIENTMRVTIDPIASVEEVRTGLQNAANQAFSINSLLAPYTEARDTGAVDNFYIDANGLRSRAEYGRITAELEAQVNGYTGETLQAYEAGQTYIENLSPEEYAIGFDFYRVEGREGLDFETTTALADEAGLTMNRDAARIAYEAGVKEADGVNETTYTKGETTYGEEKDFLGGYFRRRNAENTERSSISGTAQKENGRSEKTTIKTARGRATFEAVREGELSDKQQRETAIARAYGYDLYHVPQGSEMTLKGYRHTMEQTALVWDDLPIIFARDGIDVEYVYHELYHLFVNNNQLGKSQLMESLGNQIDYNSAAWQKYEAMCENAYGVDVPHEVICEEITADLCEYAMSGSDKMAGRLTGLMPDEALQELVGEARALFDANRGGEQGEQDYTSRQGTNGASKGFLADEDTALMQTALDAVDTQQRTEMLNQELAQQFHEAAGIFVQDQYNDIRSVEGGNTYGAEEKQIEGSTRETIEGMEERNGTGENAGGDRAWETAQETSGGEGSLYSERIGISDPSFGEKPYRTWAQEGLVTPQADSVVYREQQIAMEYGIPSFVVSDEVFEKNDIQSPSFAAGGQVYFRESIDASYNGKIAKHEANHVMREVGYQPYLDFVDSVPERLNIHSEEFQEIAEHVSKHTGIDPFNASEIELQRFYDELNATVYSHIAVNDTAMLERIRPAFVDLDAYIADIQSIHEQFKESRSVDSLLMQTALDTVDTQNQVRQLENEFSQLNWQAETRRVRPALEQMASRYNNPNTAQAFVDGYDGSMTPQVYALGFDEVYSMAQQGYSLDEIMSNPENTYSHMLTTKQVELAYEAGMAERNLLQNGDESDRLDEESWEESSEDNLDGELKYWEKLLGKLKDNVKIQSYNSAESINSWWASRDYTDPPYTPNTIVLDIQLTQDTTFVRVYDNKVSGLKGGWIMRANDIDGLTPKQIQEKFALPSIPVYIGEVRLKAGDTIRMGKVNSNYGFDGGGIQFDLKGQYIGEFREIGELKDWSFENE